jgi:PAS domain S-box-containing protein
MSAPESNNPQVPDRFEALVRALTLIEGHTGQAALDAIVAQLGKVFAARRVHLSTPHPEQSDCFKIIAHWPEMDEKAPRVYPLARSVSEAAWQRGEITAWAGLEEQFPGSLAAFVEWQTQALIGFRLQEADGRRLGVLILSLGAAPADRCFTVALTKLFAQRAAGELARFRLEEERFAAARERIATEAWLHAEATHFAEVFDRTEDAVFFLRVEAPDHFVYERVNIRVAAIVGMVPEDFIGRTPAEIFSPAAAEQMHADNLECMRRGEVIVKERSVAFSTGARTFRISLSPSRDTTGRIVRLVGLATDITDLRRQQDLLAESEALARMGGWELDYASGRLLWTPGTYRIFERDPALFTPILEHSLRDGGPFEFVAKARLDSGRIIHVRAIGQPTQVEGRTVRIFGGVQDITLKVEADAQRMRLEAQLRRAQKMEAVGTLAGGVAHDFNNILSGIMGNTQLAQLELSPDAPANRFLQNAYQGCLRARDLVRRILTFSRRAEHEHAVFVLQPLVTEALALLRATLPASISLRTAFAPEPLQVLADASQLHQVVLNLCTNAAQAMRSQGGVLLVELALTQPGDEWHRQHPEVREDHGVRLTVRDTGDGIAEETLERIFEPFFTTKPFGEGSGLGLAVVHGIVESHAGAIVVESRVGEGSAFHVFLPGQVRTAPPPKTADAVPLQPKLQGAGKAILVVDDESAITTLIAPLLSHLGYRSSVYNHPRRALEAFQKAPDSYDAVLCDLTMPDMDGITFCSAIRADHPELPLVLMTGYLRTTDQEAMRAVGIHVSIAKPFSLETLANALCEAFPPAPAEPKHAKHA